MRSESKTETRPEVSYLDHVRWQLHDDAELNQDGHGVFFARLRGHTVTFAGGKVMMGVLRLVVDGDAPTTALRKRRITEESWEGYLRELHELVLAGVLHPDTEG